MKKKLFAGIGVLALSLSVIGSASASGQSELAEIRKATAKYHNEAAAIADGYTKVPVEANAAIPGLGVMGLHYINFELLADPEIDPTKPEVLLYVPSKDSKDGVRLVGVEYVVASEEWSIKDESGNVIATFPGWADTENPPSVFGQTFEGPMKGHVDGEPSHYDKHVWLWQANPKGFNLDDEGNILYNVPGIFSQWNATLKSN